MKEAMRQQVQEVGENGGGGGSQRHFGGKFTYTAMERAHALALAALSPSLVAKEVAIAGRASGLPASVASQEAAPRAGGNATAVRIMGAGRAADGDGPTTNGY
jgi:hypothetical protein